MTATPAFDGAVASAADAEAYELGDAMLQLLAGSRLVRAGELDMATFMASQADYDTYPADAGPWGTRPAGSA